MGLRRLAIRRSAAALAAACIAAAGLAAPAAAPAGAERCRTFHHAAKVESDPFGTDLAYLHLRQRVCWDGQVITRTGRLVAYPEVTSAGTIGNWLWEGFTRRPVSRLRPAGGRRAGSRVLYAAGQFSQRIYKYTSTAQAWVKIRVFGDGRARRLSLDG